MYLGVQLGQRFQHGAWRVFAHNRQLKTLRRSYCPDLFIRCGRAAHEFYEDDARVVVEVLSPSNGAADLTTIIAIHERTGQSWTERQTRGERVQLGQACVDLADLWMRLDEQSTFD